MSTSGEAVFWIIWKSSEKLVIELDCDAHGEYQKIEKAKIMDKNLEDFGFTVLRLKNRCIPVWKAYKRTIGLR